MATIAQSMAIFILVILLTLLPAVDAAASRKHRTIPDHLKSLVENARRTVIDDNRRQRPTTTTNAPQKAWGIDNLMRIGNQLERLFRRLSAVRSREDDIYDQIRAKSRRQRASFEMTLLENMQCQQEELLSCDQYESNERICYPTATGMFCCRCTGQLLRDQIQVVG